MRKNSALLILLIWTCPQVEAQDLQPAALARFTKWREALSSTTALEQDGSARITIKRINSPDIVMTGDSYFSYCKDRHILVELGVTTFAWQGATAKVYDHEKRVVYAVGAPRKGGVAELLRPVGQDGSESGAEDDLVANVGAALSSPVDAKDAATAFASYLGTFSWSPLFDVEADKRIRDDLIVATIRDVEKGGRVKVELKFRFGRKCVVEFDTKSNLVTSVSMEFGDEEVTDLGGLRVAVCWEVKRETTDVRQVEDRYNERLKLLSDRARGYRSPKPFPPGPGKSVVVPTGSTGKGLLGFLDRWVKVITTRGQEPKK